MKKLTAGIFTVLIGLCAANSADATVASSAWVNEKVSALATTVSNNATAAADATKAVADDLADYITDNNAAVALKAAQADLDATNTLVGTLPADAGADTIVGYIQKRTEGIATDAALTTLTGRVSVNEGAIETLNGTGAGSVSKSIADALATYTNTEGVDAKVKVVSDALAEHVTAADGKYATITNLNAANQAIADLETSKEAAANKVQVGAGGSLTEEQKGSTELYPSMATTSKMISDANVAIDQKFQQIHSEESGILVQAKGYTNTQVNSLKNTEIKANTEAIATINDAENGILAQAKAYAKEQADAASGSASDVADDLSEFKTTVSDTYATQESLGTTNTNVTNLTTRVGTNETNIATNAENIAKNAKTAADNATAIATNAENIAKNVTAIATAQAQADKGVADAAAAKSAADAAQATADAAIPKPTGECSDPDNKCVLTYNNAAYTWEVIERANGEVAE